MNKNIQKKNILFVPGRMLSAVGEAIYKSHDYRRCF